MKNIVKNNNIKNEIINKIKIFYKKKIEFKLILSIIIL